jgi:hypothetical protein
VVALSISVVSFPLLLDRDVGVLVAVQTSVKAVLANLFTMALWGLIVASILAIGFLLMFVGLAVAVPILAHSSWHLYRKVVDHAAPRPQTPKSGWKNDQNKWSRSIWYYPREHDQIRCNRSSPVFVLTQIIREIGAHFRGSS